jgi:cobalt/nickel transport system permease protein
VGIVLLWKTAVHIPDGFLSTPVWITLDAIAVPAVVLTVRRAQHGFEESKVPLLGVMGAFVFAAQMINFPVGIGTSGHLVGGALLACTLGPSAASVVMIAILAIQALVFQDGGILALGANVLNMAVAGVLAGYLPLHFWGNGRSPANNWRRGAIFASGALSLMVSAVLAMAELLISGVRMSASLLGISFGLFALSAVLEGAITLAVIEALEKIQPGFIRKPVAGKSLAFGAQPLAFGAVALAAVLLAGVGVLFAASTPDGIQKLGLETGIAGHAQALISTPLSGYQASFLRAGWPSKAGAGLAGLGLIYGVCVLIGRGRRK